MDIVPRREGGGEEDESQAWKKGGVLCNTNKKICFLDSKSATTKYKIYIYIKINDLNVKKMSSVSERGKTSTVICKCSKILIGNQDPFIT
jgi:hypothetical protein